MHVNFLAVLVTGIVIFVLGGLWYSPVLFARRWVALMGKTEAVANWAHLHGHQVAINGAVPDRLAWHPR